MTVNELLTLKPGELVVIKERSEVDNPVELEAYISGMDIYAGEVFAVTGEKTYPAESPMNYAGIRLKNENGGQLPYWWFSSFIDKYIDTSAFDEVASDEELEAMLKSF